MATLREARLQARRLLEAGEPARALLAYERILAALPLDFDARLKIADALAKLAARAEAVAVYRVVADHDIRAGHPLPAMVACKALAALGAAEADDELTTRMAEAYGAGSPRLARFAARQAPVDPESPLPPRERGAPELAPLIQRATRRALDLSVYAGYPEQLHAIAFFSDLEPALFVRALRAAVVRRLPDGAPIIREGEPGTAFFLCAGGELEVSAAPRAGGRTVLARLHEGALFGEMALLGAGPRMASVAAVGEADVIEIGRDSLVEMARRQPAVAAALGRFARERLLKNLLATSPLFRPFSRQQQMDLIRRFDGHDVAPGTEIIREGAPGTGLFLVLGGEVEVAKRQPGGGEVILARLRAGESFGEMSLMKNQITSATVRAARPSTVLFLAREYFRRLVDAVPEVRRSFEELADRRDLDTRIALGRKAEEPEIAEDELILV